MLLGMASVRYSNQAHWQMAHMDDFNAEQPDRRVARKVLQVKETFRADKGNGEAFKPSGVGDMLGEQVGKKVRDLSGEQVGKKVRDSRHTATEPMMPLDGAQKHYSTV